MKNKMEKEWGPPGVGLGGGMPSSGGPRAGCMVGGHPGWGGGEPSSVGGRGGEVGGGAADAPTLGGWKSPFFLTALMCVPQMNLPTTYHQHAA